MTEKLINILAILSELIRFIWIDFVRRFNMLKYLSILRYKYLYKYLSYIYKWIFFLTILEHKSRRLQKNQSFIRILFVMRLPFSNREIFSEKYSLWKRKLHVVWESCMKSRVLMPIKINAPLENWIMEDWIFSINSF